MSRTCSFFSGPDAVDKGQFAGLKPFKTVVRPKPEEVQFPEVTLNILERGMIQTPTPMVWVYPKPFVDPRRLAESLCEVLKKRPEYTGRIVGSLKEATLKPAGRGVQFEFEQALAFQLDMRSEASLFDLMKQTIERPSMSFNPLRGEQHPLLKVRIVECANAVILFAELCHALGDAKAVFSLVQQWAAVHRSMFGTARDDEGSSSSEEESRATQNMSNDATFNEATFEKWREMSAALEYKGTERKVHKVDKQPPVPSHGVTYEASVGFPPSQQLSRFWFLLKAIWDLGTANITLHFSWLHFSAAHLAALKANLSADLPEGAWISTNDALIAYLWELMALDDAKHGRLLLNVVNLRRFVSHGGDAVPHGNFVTGFTIYAHERTHRPPLKSIDGALHCDEVRTRMRDVAHESRRLLRTFTVGETAHTLARTYENFWDGEHYPYFDMRMGVMFNSYASHPVYDADFGTGRPALVRLGMALHLPIVIVWPHPTGDGLEVSVYASKNNARDLERIVAADKRLLLEVPESTGAGA